MKHDIASFEFLFFCCAHAHIQDNKTALDYAKQFDKQNFVQLIQVRCQAWVDFTSVFGTCPFSFFPHIVWLCVAISSCAIGWVIWHRNVLVTFSMHVGLISHASWLQLFNRRFSYQCNCPVARVSGGGASGGAAPTIERACKC
jgi:hypothetical protein